ncbi:MAG: hypothetical protein EON58_22725, partial [Alphaproteobacteria bacterium]
MPIRLFPGLNAPDSVKNVPTTDETGNELTHSIEPELISARIPRITRLAGSTLLLRRVLRNAWIIAVMGILFLARQDYDTWTRLIHNGVVTQAISYRREGTTEMDRVRYV